MALWGYIRNANCCCYCKIILISQMQPANCCCYSKIVPKMHTINWCCYCKIILISQMQSANCCCYCKTRWKMPTGTVIARWYHKCILQIAAVIARLYQKCLLQIAAFAKCCCLCEALSNLHIGNCFSNSRNTSNYNATLTVYILCFPPVHSTKEQRLLQCCNIFSS